MFSLANRDKPVAATLQRKCLGIIICVIITKMITKISLSKEFFCNNFGQDGSRSGKTDPVQLKGFFCFSRALFAYKNGRSASSFLLLGIGFSYILKKANLSFKRPSPNPHLNRTGSDFPLPIFVRNNKKKQTGRKIRDGTSSSSLKVPLIVPLLHCAPV